MIRKVLTAALLTAAASSANAATVFGIDGLNNLVTFNSSAPGTYLSSLQVTGLGDSVQALDFRPANGVLYALGGDKVIYTINTSSGIATALGGPLAIDGTTFGFDFNPVADAIRIVSNTNKNYRVSPVTGALIATDVDVFYPNSAVDPNVTANAYASGSTTQFAIDTAANTLVRQANNAGTLTTVGALGIDAAPRASFDIRGSDAFVYSSRTLYSANLQTGALTALGQTDDDLFGIAIAAVPEPASWAMMIGGFGLAGGVLRRRQKVVTRVSYAA